MEKEKKGFWASLFAPKPCSCSTQFEETKENSAQKEEEKHKLDEQTARALAANRLDKPKEDNVIKCKCSCDCE